MINLVSKYKGICLLFVGILLGSFGWYMLEANDLTITQMDEEKWEDYTLTTFPNLEKSTQLEEIITEKEVIKEQVPVYICGEVKQAGVYYIDEGMIIDELIKLAGGLTEEADPVNINLAQSIRKSEKIYVPKAGEKIDKTINSYDNVEYENELVNINNANESELDNLPGIGQSRAKQIIDYRETNGPFRSVDEIKNVSGVGDKIFESLKDLITVE